MRFEIQENLKLKEKMDDNGGSDESFAPIMKLISIGSLIVVSLIGKKEKKNGKLKKRTKM